MRGISQVRVRNMSDLEADKNSDATLFIGSNPNRSRGVARTARRPDMSLRSRTGNLSSLEPWRKPRPKPR